MGIEISVVLVGIEISVPRMKMEVRRCNQVEKHSCQREAIEEGEKDQRDYTEHMSIGAQQNCNVPPCRLQVRTSTPINGLYERLFFTSPERRRKNSDL